MDKVERDTAVANLEGWKEVNNSNVRDAERVPSTVNFCARAGSPGT